MDINEYSADLSVLGLSSKADQYKLTGLYAYNVFYDADEEYTEEVNDGLTIGTQSPIAGIYINEKLDEDTVEILIPYFPSSGRGLNKDDICILLGKTVNTLREIKQYSRFVNVQPRAGDILREYLFSEKGSTIPPFKLHVITNADTNEKEAFEIRKVVEEYDVSVKNVKNISAAIDFGEDIKAEIDSNHAPFDCVNDGSLLIDNPNNHLDYSSDSKVFNVSALSLKDLWKKEGKRGLLAMNLRYYIKSANIDNKIETSILNNPNDFWYLNNGIIIVCDSFEIKNKELRLKKFSIVNGGQTTRMIGTIPFEKDFYLLAKVIRNSFENTNDKNLFVSRVAEASNTQKPIKVKDIIANKVEQRNLKSLLSKNNIFIEIKRGEKCDKSLYKEPWQRTKNNELAQDLYAFVYLHPGPARNSVSKILQDQNKYRTIFENHTYSPGFIKSLLYLEKAYRDYSKYISKTTDATADATKKGLVKNGMYYVLATIGYLMKLSYNPNYVDTLRRFNGNEQIGDFFASEQAFDFDFVKKAKYKDFSLSIRKLFDAIIDYLIKKEFEKTKRDQPELAYSNWTKSDKGFLSIRDNINFDVFQTGEFKFSKLIYEAFGKGDEKLILENKKLFESNCEKNRNESGKTENGIELSERDTLLRDELMKFRMMVSSTKHIQENRIFTDKMLTMIVNRKPLTSDSLLKIIGGSSLHFVGDEILAIVKKYQ